MPPLMHSVDGAKKNEEHFGSFIFCALVTDKINKVRYNTIIYLLNIQLN